ncbi:hypothetical protein [Streptomyces sp. NPDC048411]
MTDDLVEFLRARLDEEADLALPYADHADHRQEWLPHRMRDSD